MIKPIKPKEKDERFDGVLLDEAVGYINESITLRRWHDNLGDEEKYRKDYFAIIIAPYGRFDAKLMQKVVECFKDDGWNCLYKGCYDARGPHECFYVGREHF